MKLATHLLTFITVLFFASHAQAQSKVSPISIRVDPTSKPNKDKNKEQKAVSRILKILVTNNSTQPVEVKLKYAHMVRAAKAKELSAAGAGEKTITVKPRSTETVETDVHTAVWIPGKVDDKTKKKADDTGEKFAGFGAQAFVEDKLASASYSPQSVKQSWGGEK